MKELEKIIERASCPCRDEECQRELAHVRHAVREALEMVAIQIQRVPVESYHCLKAVTLREAAETIKALAATIDEEKP